MDSRLHVEVVVVCVGSRQDKPEQLWAVTSSAVAVAYSRGPSRVNLRRQPQEPQRAQFLGEQPQPARSGSIRLVPGSSPHKGLVALAQVESAQGVQLRGVSSS